jgi:glycosyltransferase involved in cell wall biosynthesis
MPVTKHIWKNATSIIALSDSLRKKALKTYPGLKINVIPNGIESHIFRPCKSNYNVKNFKIITVSRLIERKGIQHILKALAELRKEDATIKNIFLLIVGTGKYEYQLKYLCKQLNLTNIVTFYGFCQRSDLPKLYGQSDIFILPSLAESFGVVFAEAMSCGLPIIGSNVGAIPDLVDDINGILVEPGNPTSLKEAIKYMINNKNKWYSMGSASRAKICEQYSWESIAQKYSYICSLGMYSSILEKPLSSLETVCN